MKKVIVLLIILGLFLIPAILTAQDEQAGVWQIKSIDLCGDWCDKENAKSGSMVIPSFDCPPEIKVEAINILLKNGWQLQEEYQGERFIYLKKRVRE